MAQGIEIYDEDGDIVYSTVDVTWNQVASFQVNGGASVSNSYPILSGKTVQTVQMFINPPPTTRKALAHTVTVTGTTVAVSGGNEDILVLVLMR